MHAKRFLICLSIVCAVLVSFGLAKAVAESIIKYQDSQGKTHFVNDPAKVPNEYKSQLSNSAELPSISRVSSGEYGSTKRKLSNPRNYKVRILVTSWCPSCQALEKWLKAKRIKFTKYDIEHQVRGKRLYRQHGGRGVPVTLVGNKSPIVGFNRKLLTNTLGIN